MGNFEAARIMMSSGGGSGYTGIELTTNSNGTYIPPTGKLYNSVTAMISQPVQADMILIDNGILSSRYFSTCNGFTYGKNFHFLVKYPTQTSPYGQINEFIDSIFSNQYQCVWENTDKNRYEFTNFNKQIPLFYELYYHGSEIDYPTDQALIIFRDFAGMNRWYNTYELNDVSGRRELYGYMKENDNVGSTFTMTASNPVYSLYIDPDNPENNQLGVSIDFTTRSYWLTKYYTYGNTLDDDTENDWNPNARSWSWTSGGTNSMAIISDTSVFWTNPEVNKDLNKDTFSIIKDVIKDVFEAKHKGEI